MARIDVFLSQLLTYEADALLLEGGDNLYLVKGDRRVPLMQVRPGVLANAHIVALLGDIAPPDVREQLERGEACAWEYRASGVPFSVELVAVDARLLARIRPSAFAVAAVPVPSPAEAEASGDGRPAIERYLVSLLETPGATDLFLSSARPPSLRVDGDIAPLPGAAPVEPYALQRMIEDILPDSQRAAFERAHEAEFAYQMPQARVRCSVFRETNGIAGVFRCFPNALRTAADLGIGDDILDLALLPAGLVLVAGPHASGTSTTLAALIDHINGRRAAHVVSIEDPIERRHASRRALVHQRQVGEHTGGMAAAARAAGREDADVVVLAHLHDIEAVYAALDLVAAGVLVIAGVRAPSAVAAVHRIVDLFPPDRHQQARLHLGESLQGIVSQAIDRGLGLPRRARFELVRDSIEIGSVIIDRATGLEPLELAGPRAHPQA